MNNKGFSLIELMIVVAIIGILSAIAIPNFQRFQAKSKQSEAKAQLSSMYTAQKAFRNEWGFYFADFRDVGYNPEGELRYRITNVASARTLPVNYTFQGGAGAGAAAATITTTLYCALGTSSCTEIAPYVVGPATAAAAMADATFTTVASSDIDVDGTADEWTINEQKQLRNPVSDL